MTGSVSLEVSSGVAVVTIDNPTLKNALSLDIAQGLLNACEEIDQDHTIGCAVLRGAGGTFCSGADTRTWDDVFPNPASDIARSQTDLLYGSFFRIGQMQVPVVAAIRGAAVGAGLNLALAADLRIVANDARLMAGFVNAGIHPGGGFFTLASRAGGRETAAALGIFSEEMSGPRAEELGVAWRCVDDSAVEQVAIDTATVAARDPMLARRMVRSFRLETNAASMQWAVALEVERGVQMWSQARRPVGTGSKAAFGASDLGEQA